MARRRFRRGEIPVPPAAAQTADLVTVYHEGLDKTLKVRRSRLAQMDPAWKPIDGYDQGGDLTPPGDDPPTADVTSNQGVPPNDEPKE